MNEMKDENNEMPADFDNEIHKWSLECNLLCTFIKIRIVFF